MGNRAVIAFESMPEVGIYVHWNGGPESVLAFLEETELRGARSPGSDPSYSFARLVQTIAEYFTRGGERPEYATSIGVGPLAQLDTNNGDNGTYWIGDNWGIVRREHASGGVTTPSQLSVSPGTDHHGSPYPSQWDRYRAILRDLRRMRARGRRAR